MGPKPFPFSIGIGTDICQVSRIRHIAADASLLNSWARKVFTRHEWPTLYHRVVSGATEFETYGFAKLNLPAINFANQKPGVSTPNQVLHFLAGRFVFYLHLSALPCIIIFSQSMDLQMGCEGSSDQSISPYQAFYVSNLNHY